jgi:choline dehydrogenase-like flavoprotein
VPQKAAYGSLFPYRHGAAHLDLDLRGVETAPSYAKGGLSNVWGATVLPYHARDIGEWPITTSDLAPHYSAVARLLNVSETRDRLECDFPLFTDGSRFLRPSRQAEALMRDLESSEAALEDAGWLFGYSRLAVVASPGGEERGCVYCGLCLYGCPHALIYNAGSTLEMLRRHRSFTYRPDAIVTRVEEMADRVRIHVDTRGGGEHHAIEADRVCLAAGTYNTTAILLASLDAFDTPVVVRDSQIFLLPLLRSQRVADVADEPLHTLSQLFIEVVDPSLSRQTIHLQVYTYNDWYAGVVERRLGALRHLAAPVMNLLLERLIVVQGYLSSDLSHPIRVTLRRGEPRHRLTLEADENRDTTPAIRRIVAMLAKHKRDLRARPMASLLEISAPGRSYHSGGSFPMRVQPGRFESDWLGRPHGFERVHAVDATVFPTIPAAPITFSVMANAHRIGVEIASEVRS